MSRSEPPRTPPPPPPRPHIPPPTGPGRIAEVLYPVAELAELWRCTPQHIYNLIAARELEATQVGIGRAKTRISQAAVAKFLSRRTSKVRAA